MGLLEMFGLEEMGDLAPMPETTIEKKASGKTKKVADETKKPGKKPEKEEDYLVVLPVTVKSRGFKTELEGTGELKISAVFEKLCEMGYEEVSIPGINAVYDASISTVYITTALMPDAERTAVSFTDGNITILDGMTKCGVSADNFNKDQDEISVLDLSDYWSAVNHIYKGCGMTVAGKYAYPCFNKALPETDAVTLPCEIFINGDVISLTESDFSKENITVKDIIHKYMGNDPNTNVTGVIYANLERSCYFLAYDQKKVSKTAKGNVAVKKGEIKNAVEKYALPLKVFLAFIGREFELTPEEFDGKTRITLAEIRTYFSSKYRIFADTSRKLDSIYIEEDNYLSLMFTSGKKGAFIQSAPYQPIASPVSTVSFKKEYASSFIEKDEFPIGTFYLSKSDSGRIRGIRFSYALPKIPRHILSDVITYFRKDTAKEAYVKICYNKATNQYFVVHSKNQATKMEVVYHLPTEGLINNRNIIQVMDIHSHNTMPAYFSRVDDADECYPGLFGVIGHLDTGNPSICIRAGYEGIFTTIPVGKLF